MEKKDNNRHNTAFALHMKVQIGELIKLVGEVKSTQEKSRQYQLPTDPIAYKAMK